MMTAECGVKKGKKRISQGDKEHDAKVSRLLGAESSAVVDKDKFIVDVNIGKSDAEFSR